MKSLVHCIKWKICCVARERNRTKKRVMGRESCPISHQFKRQQSLYCMAAVAAAVCNIHHTRFSQFDNIWCSDNTVFFCWSPICVLYILYSYSLEVIFFLLYYINVCVRVYRCVPPIFSSHRNLSREILFVSFSKIENVDEEWRKIVYFFSFQFYHFKTRWFYDFFQQSSSLSKNTRTPGWCEKGLVISFFRYSLFENLKRFHSITRGEKKNNTKKNYKFFGSYANRTIELNVCLSIDKTTHRRNDLKKNP